MMAAGEDLPERHYDGRLTRLDNEVGGLKTEMGGIKAQIGSLAEGQSVIFTKLDALGGKIEAARPGIGAIWGPLGVLVATLLGFGGLLAQPYVQAINEGRAALTDHVTRSDRRDEEITLLRIETAVLRDRIERGTVKATR